MRNGNIVLMLVYEPVSAEVEPIPLARISHDGLAVAVAVSAVLDAEVRAQETSSCDEILAEMRQIEVRRLRELFRLVVPGFEKQDQPEVSNAVVM